MLINWSFSSFSSWRNHCTENKISKNLLRTMRNSVHQTDNSLFWHIKISYETESGKSMNFFIFCIFFNFISLSRSSSWIISLMCRILHGWKNMPLYPRNFSLTVQHFSLNSATYSNVFSPDEQYGEQFCNNSSPEWGLNAGRQSAIRYKRWTEFIISWTGISPPR